MACQPQERKGIQDEAKEHTLDRQRKPKAIAMEDEGRITIREHVEQHDACGSDKSGLPALQQRQEADDGQLRLEKTFHAGQLAGSAPYGRLVYLSPQQQ